jgi:hypothetical protein
MRVRMAEEFSRENSDKSSFMFAPRLIANSNWMRSVSIPVGQ